MGCDDGRMSVDVRECTAIGGIPCEDEDHSAEVVGSSAC